MIQENLLQAIQKIGINRLSEMQLASYEESLSTPHVILLSPTGSGKTLAYLLPLITQLDAQVKHPQALIILPTRELAQQSHQVFKDIIHALDADIASICLHGGKSTTNETKALHQEEIQVIFATPGRLLDHIEKNNINTSFLHLLYIDEFDKCLELGFQEDIQHIYQAIPHCSNIFLLSATYSIEDELPQSLFHVHFTTIDFLGEENTPQYSLLVCNTPEKDKLSTLPALLSEIMLRDRESANIIIFAAHRESVDRIATFLAPFHFHIVTYHGGQEQDIREKNLFLFKSQIANILISTDLAARGLDIEHVRTIVHYHLPSTIEDFTHRNGRSTRWENNGEVILLKGPEEELPAFLPPIDKNFSVLENKTIFVQPAKYQPIYIGKGKLDKISKADIMGFLCKKGHLNKDDIGTISVQKNASFAAIKKNKVNEMLKLVQGEKIKGIKTIIERMKI